MSDLSGYEGPALDLRSLIEDSHQLQELTRHPGWATLKRLAGDSIDAQQGRLNSGHIKSLEDYRSLVGWLDGARQLLAIPQTVAERLARAQEAEEELRAEMEAEVEGTPRAEYPEPIYEGAER